MMQVLTMLVVCFWTAMLTLALPQIRFYFAMRRIKKAIKKELDLYDKQRADFIKRVSEWSEVEDTDEIKQIMVNTLPDSTGFSN